MLRGVDSCVCVHVHILADHVTYSISYLAVSLVKTATTIRLE